MTFEAAPFEPAAGDPLAAEHSLLTEYFISYRNRQEARKFEPPPEKTAILKSDAAQAIKFTHAALVQLEYWRAAEAQPVDQEVAAYASREIRYLEALVEDLLKRGLPLQKPQIMLLLSLAQNHKSNLCLKAKAITQALTKLAKKNQIDAELLHAMKAYLKTVKLEWHDYKTCRQNLAILCGDVEAALNATEPTPEQDSTPVTKKSKASGRSKTETTPAAAVPEEPSKPPIPIAPAPAGNPFVLNALKRFLGMIPNNTPVESITIGDDQYPIPKESPLNLAHQVVSAFLRAVAEVRISAALSEFSKHFKQLTPQERGLVLLATAERHVEPEIPGSLQKPATGNVSFYYTQLIDALVETPLAFDRSCLFDLLLYLAMTEHGSGLFSSKAIGQFLTQLEEEAAKQPLTEGERYVLTLLRTSRVDGPMMGVPRDDIARLNRLVGDDAVYYLSSGEDWTDTINADLSSQPPKVRKCWGQLFRHALSATSARPNAKWLKSASALIQELGDDVVLAAMERWLSRVGKGSTSFVGKLAPLSPHVRDSIDPQNADTLRGLIWIASTLERRSELLRTFGALALYSYKKIPGVGPRLPKIGNAAVYAISEVGTVEAVGQLAILKVRVKFIPAQKEIEKAFESLAAELQLPREEIEEMGVPTYGLEEVGLLREQFGDYRAELRIDGSDAAIHWFDAVGKQLKSVPAKVKGEHKEEFKELQQSLKDIQGMLPAQRDRIDSMFLAQMSWPMETWRERYLDHALVGTIVRRLIWCVDGAAAFFVDGKPLDAKGKPIEHGKTAEITLWHPIGKSLDEITAWRQFLEQREIVQPFRQAHREVYLLTDAERGTNTYSNRFAAHVLRQHQFNALCGARGWRNKLRLYVDDTYPPATRELPKWNLRAEFWIEGIGTDHGVDTNESGVFHRLSTDQVRFYNIQAPAHEAQAGRGGYTTTYRGRGREESNEPIPLDQIPPLVLSEIMRDVDLFVGVSSVGNDPTWNDGGPNGRFRDYWQGYSFGVLSGSANSRKEVLERLVPRLKIADRCSFSERFLVVRGKKRTYKIHLGSGNILMEPNDQYLCIVPDARTRAASGDLYLPFEGDNVLSIILSKAFLLADDLKIKDPTITRQIDSK